MNKVNLIEHPLIQHKLTWMRDKSTSSASFRRLLRDISVLMAYEVVRDIPMVTKTIDTPMVTTESQVIEEEQIAIISVLRAGNGMADGMLEILPYARVGHVGLYRDHDTLEPIHYYFKVPDNISELYAIVVDPMLATGSSAVAAVAKMKEVRPASIRFACLLAAPEGIRALSEAHPDVQIYTPAVDERLNEKGYILPGLGDAGDRIYGTC